MNAAVASAVARAGSRKKALKLIYAYDCVSFRYRKNGAHKCDALDKAYCLVEDEPCKFRKAGEGTHDAHTQEQGIHG